MSALRSSGRNATESSEGNYRGCGHAQALFPQWFGPAAGLITVAGLSVHAFGMWDKHRLETIDQSQNRLWIVALYWMCWLSLVVILAMLFLWRR